MPNLTRLSLRTKLLILIPLILGGGALLAGQALADAIHWLQLAPETLDSLHDLSCGLVPICDLRYPGYFGLALALILVALVLLALALYRSALAITQDVDWSLPTVERRGWDWLALGLAAAALIVTALVVVSAFNSDDHFPAPPGWLAAIILWAITSYRLDHVRATPALTRRGVAQVIGYIVLLIALGFVYHLPILREAVPRSLFVVLVILITLALWRVGRISGIVLVFTLIAVAGLAVYTYNIDSWHYAFIGDEYAFFNAASSFFRDAAQLNILDPKGVYDSHPIFASMLQALNMALFGGDIYSWRLSSLLMVFLSVPPIYLLVREIRGSRTGLLAAVLYVSAHQLIGFAHVGYNSTQVLPGFAAMLALTLLAIRRQSRLAIFLCGVAASLTFFTYTLTIPLIPLPLILLGLWALWPSRAVPLLRRIVAALPLALIFLLGVMVTASPRLLNTRWFSDAASNTLLSHSEIPNMTNPLLQQILPNTLYTLTGTLYFDENSHYVSGQNLDPLSSLLMIAGIAGLIAALLQRRVALWLLISFAASVFLIGLSTPYPYPTHTRTFILVIFYAAFAALGASYLWETAREVGLRLSAATLRLAAVTLVVLVIALNAYQFFDLAPKDIAQTLIAMMVREFQIDPPQTTLYYAAQAPNDQNMLMVLNAFQLDTQRLQPVMSPVPELALTTVKREAKPPYRIILVADLPDLQGWLDVAQQLWPDHSPQMVRDGSGQPQFQVIDVPG